MSVVFLITMLSAILLNVVLLNFTVLNIIILNDTMLNVIELSVVKTLNGPGYQATEPICNGEQKDSPLEIVFSGKEYKLFPYLLVVI